MHFILKLQKSLYPAFKCHNRAGIECTSSMQSLRILSLLAHTEICSSIRFCLFVMVFFHYWLQDTSRPWKCFNVMLSKKLGNLSLFMTWRIIVHEYELPCARKISSTSLQSFSWGTRHCFLLILVHIAFDDLQTTSAKDTHSTAHHDLDGVFHPLLACWRLWA